MSTGPYLIPNLDYKVDRRLHQHDGERRLSRRRSARSRLLPRAGDGPAGRRGRASIRPKFAASTSSSPISSPTPPSPAKRYDTGEYEKALEQGARSLTTTPIFARSRRNCARQGRYLGIGLGVLCRDLRLRTVRELDRPGRAERRRDRSSPASRRTVRARRPPSPSSPPTTSAPISRMSSSITATPATPRRATARWAAAGWRSAARRWSMSLNKIKDKAKRIAAHMLEASVEDIELSEGKYQVKGVPTEGLTLGDIAAKAYSGDLPDDIEPGLETTNFFKPGRRDLPVRLAHRRGRSLPRDRRGQAAALSSRSTTAARSSAPMLVDRPGARRSRPGHRPGALGGDALRRRAASC